MKNLHVLFFIFITKILSAAPEAVIVSLDQEALSVIEKEIEIQQQYRLSRDLSMIRLNEFDIERMAALIHHELNRCGGFIVEPDDGRSFRSFVSKSSLSKYPTNFYSISENTRVEEAFQSIEEEDLHFVIDKLSSFQNRYYRTTSGKKSQMWIYHQWKNLSQKIPNSRVELVVHRNFPQPSVIFEMRGATHPDEIIVIGGHGDSTSGWHPGEHTRAPGADDNASGIATIMSTVRALGRIKFHPKRTIQFISYAAEEVGLRGSMDIASRYRRENRDVVGVLQLDMTNFRGSPYDIVFMEDYTDRNQNQFLKDLTKRYLKDVQIANDKCGYACSDHASWTRSGYPASMPFEAKFADYNPNIHTDHDTLDQSDNSVEHAGNFLKLSIAFAIEMSKENLELKKMQ